MEGLGVNGMWRGRRVLVTGHTGFKGSWLLLLLERLGADVRGLALAPDDSPNPFEALHPGRAVHPVDLLDVGAVARTVAEAEPEVVFHFAAQAQVRDSYRAPLDTFATNLTGTLHLLEVVRNCPSVSAVVIATTDKVYAAPHHTPRSEGDPLGGSDVYSSSKACVEMAVTAWRASFLSAGPAVITVRAGNVIGGGDWSSERLVPDLVRAHREGQPITLRFPKAVRPWQHVLDCLDGYRRVAERLLSDPSSMPPALNIGPDPSAVATVEAVATRMAAVWNGTLGYRHVSSEWAEQDVLLLNAGLARGLLDWGPKLDFDDMLGWTAEWYAAHAAGDDMRAFSIAQLSRYEALKG